MREDERNSIHAIQIRARMFMLKSCLGSVLRGLNNGDMGKCISEIDLSNYLIHWRAVCVRICFSQGCHKDCLGKREPISGFLSVISPKMHQLFICSIDWRKKQFDLLKKIFKITEFKTLVLHIRKPKLWRSFPNMDKMKQ